MEKLYERARHSVDTTIQSFLQGVKTIEKNLLIKVN